VGPAQVAPGFRFPKGKPVLLLISPKVNSAEVRAYADMRRVFDGRARFIGLDAKSDVGQRALKHFSVEMPPAFVLADSSGRVVLKSQGNVDPAAIRAKLEALVKSGRK
jgi:hypothetical protein